MGFYQQRKNVQIRAIAVIATMGLGVLSVVLFKLRRAPKSTWLAVRGLMMLIGFVGIHLVSLHRLEYWLRKITLGIPFGNWLEILGVLIVLVSALIHCEQKVLSIDSTAS